MNKYLSMKIYYVNNFGKFQQHNFEICQVVAEPTTAEYSDALAQGFLQRPYREEICWLQFRSTRVKLSETNYQLYDKACILEHYNFNQLLEINNRYLTVKNYVAASEDMILFDNDIIFGYGEPLVAWSKIRDYGIAYETVYFAWTYSEPKLRLGYRSLEHEIAWAKAIGHEYLYLGPGYETCSKYKSKFIGFEWWTGSEWSRDCDRYNWLCNRETRIETFSQYEQEVYNAK
jgi:arginyl-tRNA--protein-N-Asp/Glu arginylyltransferase